MSSKRIICSPEVGGNSCDVSVASVGDPSFTDERSFLQQPLLKNQLSTQDMVKYKKTINTNYKKNTSKKKGEINKEVSKQVYKIYNYEVTEEDIIQSVELQLGLPHENKRPIRNTTREPQSKTYNSHVLDGAGENEAQPTISNDLWDFKGDPLRPRKNNILRLYYNNCNGMEINPLIKTKLIQKTEKKEKKFLGRVNEDTKVEKMFNQMKLWEVNIICLSETCVAWESHAARRVINMVTKPFDKIGCWTTSSSKVKTDSLYKPGGTGIFVDGQWCGRMIDRGSDWTGMGRWSYVTITGKGGEKITIITGYRCGQTPIKSLGSRTAGYQQYSIMRTNGEKKPNPALAFFRDLEKWLLPKVESGEEIILTMDANEVWTEDSEVQKFALAFGLIDLAKAAHENLPPTNPTANRTIDYILGTQKILTAMVALGATPYNKEMLGDHRGLYLDLDIKTLLQNTTIDQNRSLARRLQSTDKASKKRYLDNLREKFKHHKVSERLKHLGTISSEEWKKTSQQLVNEFDKIHEDVYRLCISSEKKCKRYNNKTEYWSPDLCEAVYRHRYWNMRRAELESGQSKSKQLQHITRTFKIEDNTNTLNEAIGKLKEAKSELDALLEDAKEVRSKYLVSLAESYSDKNKIPLKKAITELLLHEEEREIYASIRKS